MVEKSFPGTLKILYTFIYNGMLVGKCVVALDGHKEKKVIYFLIKIKERLLKQPSSFL